MASDGSLALVDELDIPVMHDDQHGTAVVILAGLMNAAAVVGKRMDDLTIVLTGSGAAGTATIKMLLAAGVPLLAALRRSRLAPVTTRSDPQVPA